MPATPAPFTPDAYGAAASTVTIAATAASGAVALPLLQTPPRTIRIVNLGPNKAFIRFSDNNANPTATTGDMPIPNGALEVMDLGNATNVAAICAATETAAIYFTIGQGGISA